MVIILSAVETVDLFYNSLVFFFSHGHGMDLATGILEQFICTGVDVFFDEPGKQWIAWIFSAETVNLRQFSVQTEGNMTVIGIGVTLNHFREISSCMGKQYVNFALFNENPSFLSEHLDAGLKCHGHPKNMETHNGYV